jgi:hypothetical protein
VDDAAPPAPKSQRRAAAERSMQITLECGGYRRFLFFLFFLFFFRSFPLFFVLLVQVSAEKKERKRR